MARITRRSYKRQRTIIGLALFMSISLISSGFAAFVISSTAKEETGGQVEVGTVVDKALTITIDEPLNPEDRTIIFDTFQEDKHGSVRSGDEGPYEHLSFTVTGTIGNYDFLSSLNFKLEETGSSNMLSAESAGYIKLPDCMKPDGVTFTNEQVNEVKANGGKFSFTVTFDWGKAFNFLNPGEYFDNYQYVNTQWQALTEPDLRALESANGLGSGELKLFEGGKNEIISQLVDFRKTVYGADSNYTYETQDNPTYQGPNFKLIITAAAS